MDVNLRFSSVVKLPWNFKLIKLVMKIKNRWHKKYTTFKDSGTKHNSLNIVRRVCFAGILQQPGVQIRELQFRTDQVLVQGNAKLLRDAFRRRILHGQTSVLGKRVGRTKRTGNTRSKYPPAYPPTLLCGCHGNKKRTNFIWL